MIEWRIVVTITAAILYAAALAAVVIYYGQGA